MAASVIEPINYAFSRVGRMLFKPFDIRKWFVLGFCAWLAGLAEGGGARFNFNVRSPGPSGGQALRDEFQDGLAWVQQHLGPILLLGITLFVVIVVIWLVLLWLSSRGKFMFLDGVVRDRGAVVEPWHQFRDLGNSLFGFRVVLTVVATAGFVLAVVIGLAIAWEDIQAWRFGDMALLGILAFLLPVLPCSLALFLITRLLEDFVVPAMYLRGVGTVQGWRVVLGEMMPGRVGPTVLFYLMKIVLVIGVTAVLLVLACVTCCIFSCLSALPYLGAVLLLPVSVFWRCYSLYFIQTFGDPWRVFSEESPLLEPAVPPAPPPA